MESVTTKDVLVWGAIAVGAYFLYKLLAPVVGAAGQVASAIGTGAETVGKGVANLWVRLTVAPPMNLTGNVQFPDGTQLPQSQIPIKTDGQGNLYTYANGITYQFQPWVLDANGNAVYPVVPVGS